MRRREDITVTVVSTIAGAYRLSWLVALIDQDPAARRQIRKLEPDLDALLEAIPTRLRWEPSDQQRALHHQRHQQRDIDDARVYVDRKIAEGKTRREARRAHKRALYATSPTRVIRRMWHDEQQHLAAQPQRAA